MAEVSGSEILVYEASDGDLRVDLCLGRETVGLTQQRMAELFGRERSVVTKHVRNVFKEGEVSEESSVHLLHIAGLQKELMIRLVFNLLEDER